MNQRLGFVTLLFLIVFTPFGLLLQSCGEDGTSPPTPNFALKLQVRDTNGAPVSGLQVRAWSLIPSRFTQDGKQVINGAKPSTKFEVGTPVRCRISYVIHDFTGEQIITLVDAVMDAGRHFVIWDGWRTDLPEPARAPAGVYRAVFTATDTTGQYTLFEKELFAVMYLIDGEIVQLGTTDQDGRLTSTADHMFGHLHQEGWAPFSARDEIGDDLGTFSYLDEARIVLIDPITQQSTQHDVVLENQRNSVNLVWDPPPPATLVTRAEAGNNPIQPHRPEPPLEFIVKQNYPNPFN